MSAGARIGDVLASKYRLEELLGSGGMGDVYRAVNVEIERAVAIKVLRPEHAENAHVVDRFLREARAANLVRHPNVVDVVDVGRDDSGAPFIVQELLTGEDFAHYVQRRGGRLSLDEIRELVLPVLDAVAEAHARGVTHRDLKPENVFIAQQGGRRVPKLLDFGISKVRLPNVKATEVGMTMGTPAYMSPEQVMRSHEADPRSDVWALGVILFEILAGRLPFEAEDAPALFVAIATQDAPLLTDVIADAPPSLSKVVARCLRREPAERYPSGLELARDLRHVLAGDEIEPTQRRSIPPLALRPPLPVPDLELPPSPRKPAAPTLKGPSPPTPVGLSKTELSLAQPPAPSRPAIVNAPAVPELVAPAARSSARMAAAAQPSSARMAAASVPDPLGPPPSASGLVLDAAPVPVPAPAHQPRPRPVAPASAAIVGPPRSADPPRAHAAGTSDMTHLVALGAVALTAVGVTAALMTFAYRPDGWPVVAIFTVPTPTVNLVINGGLALVGFVLAAQFVVNGVKRWRGFVAGGRVGAIVQALIAGGFLFAALQLAKAAF